VVPPVVAAVVVAVVLAVLVLVLAVEVELIALYAGAGVKAMES